MTVRYYIRLPDPQKARGEDPDLSFRSVSPDGFAKELHAALSTDVLVNKWRTKLGSDEEVDERFVVIDDAATVVGKLHDLHIDLEVTTGLSSEVLKNRMHLLAGSHWELHDVQSV